MFNRMTKGEEGSGPLRSVEATGAAMYDEPEDLDEDEISGRPKSLRRFR